MVANFVARFVGPRGGAELSSRLYRQVDKAATSVVLNIAEANGRYPQADRRRFHDPAEASAVKAAAYVDLCVRQGELDPTERGTGVRLLGRIALMLRGLRERLRSSRHTFDKALCDKVCDEVRDEVCGGVRDEVCDGVCDEGRVAPRKMSRL